MSSSKFLRYKSLAIASLAGCVVGASFERVRNSEQLKGIKSGLVASAATIEPRRESDIVDTSSFSPLKDYPSKRDRINEIVRHHGYPASDTIRIHDNYVLSYDRKNRTANWVLEHLSPNLLNSAESKEVDRSKCEFMEDVQVHPFFRSSNEDYFGSGFDRGHLAAAGNHKVSQEIINQTFFLSNISPQVGKGFNRDTWNNLERYVRFRGSRCRNLWLCTGPLYLPRKDPLDGKLYVKYQVIGNNNVSVPTHFFKVLLVEDTDGSFHLESYVMPNQVLDPSIPLRSYQVPLESIERSAGFLIFNHVPKKLFQSINSTNKYLQKFDKSLQQELIHGFKKDRTRA